MREPYKKPLDFYMTKTKELKEKYDKDNKTYKEKILRLKSRYEKLNQWNKEDSIPELFKQKKVLELQVQSANRAIKTLNKRYDALNLTNVLLLHEITELEHTNKGLGHINDQRAEIISKIKQLRSSEQNTTERQQLTISHQNAEIEKLQGKTEEQQTTIDTNKSALKAIEARKKELEVKIERFETKIGSIEREIKELRAADKKQKETITRQARKILQQKSYSETLQNELLKFKRNLLESNEKTSSLSSSYATLRQSKGKLEDTILGHNETIASLKKLIFKKDSFTEILNGILEKSKEEHARDEKAYTSLGQETTQLKMKLENIRGEFVKANRIHKNEMHILSEKNARLHKKNELTEARHAEIHKLTEQPATSPTKRERSSSMATEKQRLKKQDCKEQIKNKEALFKIINKQQAEFIKKQCSLIKTYPQRTVLQTQLYQFIQGKNNSSQLLMQNTGAPLDLGSLPLEEKKIVHKAFYVFFKLAGKSDSFFPENEKKKFEYRRLYKKSRAEYKHSTEKEDLNESTTSIISEF